MFLLLLVAVEDCGIIPNSCHVLVFLGEYWSWQVIVMQADVDHCRCMVEVASRLPACLNICFQLLCVKLGKGCRRRVADDLENVGCLGRECAMAYGIEQNFNQILAFVGNAKDMLDQLRGYAVCGLQDINLAISLGMYHFFDERHLFVLERTRAFNLVEVGVGWLADDFTKNYDTGVNVIALSKSNSALTLVWQGVVIMQSLTPSSNLCTLVAL
eukprot:Gb_16504 [translate_table: standard]